MGWSKSESSTARIVEDGICYPSVKRRMTRFEAELREQQRQTAAVLLGQLYAQAALLKVSQDEGEGFYVSALDVERMLSFDRDHKERLAGQKSLVFKLFGGVSPQMLQESESLQRFARSYGYSTSVSQKREEMLAFDIDFDVANQQDWLTCEIVGASCDAAPSNKMRDLHCRELWGRVEQYQQHVTMSGVLLRLAKWSSKIASLFRLLTVYCSLFHISQLDCFVQQTSHFWCVHPYS